MTSRNSAPILIAGHEAIFDDAGQLQPWIAWGTALEREMRFYQQCPTEHGYPRFVQTTFLDAEWRPLPDRTDSIPATQVGMGILSYLKYHEWRDRRETQYLRTARAMGDYLVKESRTPDSGVYPSFTRSTGHRNGFPQRPDSGTQSDRPFEIEPDKGGIAGYALAELWAASGDATYAAQALHNARILAVNQRHGNAVQSPFPFRVDYRNGAGRGEVSGNMVYILRLYDALIAQGQHEFAKPRDALWRWIMEHQIPSAAHAGLLFAQFFEDHDTPTNRTAWAPLNLARYLLERRESLDPEWRAHCGVLIDFVRHAFTHREFGVTVCHEQDEDAQAWGGVNATYGAVLALYAKAVESPSLASEARAALNFTLYCVDEQGRPRDLHLHAAPGGWQEDAHTDVIHNYMDVLRVFPQWGVVP